ncbi:thrombospondin type 1 domain-containing protein, putative [Eimeria brunetti]|uniref:Thrombospondin type 1 domain-containing protein, putative n=1 Tax=Eimeria brunetti TaxID=51314 RepID=U6LDX1_9EIME|nr:thrombospondin type 1 domain-containing protein, putative [Eimeria brunetti]
MLQIVVLAALVLVTYCHADSTPDILKGKIYLKGDGAWVTVDFPNSLTNPLVFLGSPDYIGDYAIVPQVGNVDNKGFTARIMVPPCITADLSRIQIGVPYIVWHKTAGQDYFADSVVLSRMGDSPTFKIHTYSFNCDDWDRISSDYVVLAQIQNMAAIQEKAAEYNVTPYVYVKGSVFSRGKKYTITLSTSIATYSPNVVVAVMALGASLPTNFGGVEIELEPATLITSGSGFRHSLASPVLAFIQPYAVSATHGYAVISKSTTTCVPRIIHDCQSTTKLNEASSSYLLIAYGVRSLSSPAEQYAFEQLITWSDTAGGSTWNTEGACGKGAVQLVQVLFSDEFVVSGKLPETPSCGIQDITDLMKKLCQKQVSSDSAACQVTTEAFMNAAASSLCGAALNPSMLMRFNCDSDRQAVFSLEAGKFVVHDLCPATHFADIAGATFGCKSNVCASPNVTQCTVPGAQFPSSLELCPSCDAFNLVVFYSCKLRAESLSGYGISAHSLSGSVVYSGNIPSCACTEGSTPATQEEITAVVSWQASATPPQTFVLAGARGVALDESGKLTFSTWAPSSEQDCMSDYVKVLCKHPVEGDPDEGMMKPTPLCEEAFSTKPGKRFSHDELCRDMCSHVLKPCTESEVKLLTYDWTGYFKDHYQGKSGVVLLRNMRVMEDSGSIYTDFGVASESACANTSEYKGIFCRIDALVTSGAQTGRQPNCDGTVSLNRQNVSDYECAFWCHNAHDNCKATQPSNASICFFEAQKTHSILQQCSVPSELEDKEQRDSNMVAGTATITTAWKAVNFESPVSPNPVVFAGLLPHLGTYGNVQITGVSENGFYIRLATDPCRIGFTSSYAQVSWLAISEDSFTIPTSGTSIRAATVDAIVGESVDLLPGFKMRTSSPILLTQIQNTPTNLPMTDIAVIKTLKLTTTSSTIIIDSTAQSVKNTKYTVAYIYMDSVSDSQCPLGCKTNNLTLEAKLMDIKAGYANTVTYSKELFGDAPPLIFGNFVAKKGDRIKMVVKQGVQTSSTKSSWNPKLFVISQPSCSNFVFEGASGIYGSLLFGILHIKDNFTPNCAEAKSKGGSATDADCVAECTELSGKCPVPLGWECFIAIAPEELRAKCYIEPSVETEQTTSTTTTPPPIGASVQCRVVDMSAYLDIGWDVDAMSCSCPQGFSPCTEHQVEQDRVHWIQDVSPWGSLCRTWDAVQPVARGFVQVASDMCTSSSTLRWQQRELPLYSLDDVFLNGRIKKSGYNQCVVDTPLVFCPSASLTTTTSTAAPTWDWPENADCLPGDWSEWEKLVFAEAGGACSSLDLREYDASRCQGEGAANPETPAASALQISSENDAGADSETWSEWSSCDSPCLLNGGKAKRYKLSLKQNSRPEDEPVYHSTQSEDCPNALGSCRDDREPSCDDLIPVHDILEDREYCKDQCEKIIAQCTKRAALRGLTNLQCFAEYVAENQPIGGKCTYTQKLVTETTLPTCFPSFSRMNDDESSEFRFLDPTSSSVQCLCLTPNSVPCTAKEVFESRQISFDVVSSCPRQNTAGAMFDQGTPGSADSKLFFAAADSAKIFCPLSNSKNFEQDPYAATYSVFKTAAEMNEYCANGLEAQHQLSFSTPYDVGLDCEKLVPRTGDVTTEECARQCLQIKQDCTEKPIDFLSCIATRRETTGFNTQCATKGTIFAGRGIVFCKLVPKNCTYSEWGEWSACSATCRSGVGGVETSVRIRTRQILEPSTTGGQPCRLGGSAGGDDSSGTVQTEPCNFQKICDNSDAALTLLITPKPEPSHATWSPESADTTTTTTSPTQENTDVACEIFNMAGIKVATRFDPTYKTCRCPSYTRPCTLAEAEASRSLWNQEMMALCQEDSVAVIPLADFGFFDCETRTFKESVADFNDVTAEDHCSTDQFSSVFCVVADDVETERRQMMITMLIMLLVGTIVGIVFVLWFIQHSVDVQKVLGLRGRYVELVNMVKE